MPSSPVLVDYFGTTHIGLGRENNEDAFTVVSEKQFFVLADGMGGHQAGEVAAACAVQSLSDAIRAAPIMSLEKTCSFLRSAMTKANTHILEQARLCSHYIGMGTTLSCFVLSDQHLIYAHMGDSRLYRYRNRLTQLTKDHTLLRPTPPDRPPPRYPYRGRHVVTRAMGANPIALPDLGIIPIYAQDLYLLCSDGLSDYVPEETLSSVLSAPISIPEKGGKLLQTALEQGGRDNITLLLIQVKG